MVCMVFWLVDIRRVTFSLDTWLRGISSVKVTLVHSGPPLLWYITTRIGCGRLPRHIYTLHVSWDLNQELLYERPLISLALILFDIKQVYALLLCTLILSLLALYCSIIVYPGTLVCRSLYCKHLPCIMIKQHMNFLDLIYTCQYQKLALGVLCTHRTYYLAVTE